MNGEYTLTAEQEAAIAQLQLTIPSASYEEAHKYLVIDNPDVFSNTGDDIALVRMNWVPTAAGSTQEQRQKQMEQLDEQQKAEKESFDQEQERKQKRLQAEKENFDKGQQKKKEVLQKQHQEIEKQEQEQKSE